MLKSKILIIWKPTPEKEREDVVYVDVTQDLMKEKIVYDYLRKFYEDDIPDNEFLKEYVVKEIRNLEIVFLCDLCGKEVKTLKRISLACSDYEVCEKCLEEIINNVNLIKKENFKWITNILGNK
jgi:16S rRNA U516 pseudouridylate synthase RsuA-like enzyme